MVNNAPNALNPMPHNVHVGKSIVARLYQTMLNRLFLIIMKDEL